MLRKSVGLAAGSPVAGNLEHVSTGVLHGLQLVIPARARMSAMYCF